jgi:hypothetical protein
MAKTLAHHPWRTAVKALFGLALATAGFLLDREVSTDALRAASVALFAAGILLTRHYGVQAGELRALAREKRPYRLTHTTPGILIRLVLALAATAGSGWIHFEASLAGWLAHVPVVSGAVAVLLVLHFFRELVLGAVEDVRRED